MFTLLSYVTLIKMHYSRLQKHRDAIAVNVLENGSRATCLRQLAMVFFFFFYLNVNAHWWLQLMLIDGYSCYLLVVTVAAH